MYLAITKEQKASIVDYMMDKCTFLCKKALMGSGLSFEVLEWRDESQEWQEVIERPEDYDTKLMPARSIPQTYTDGVVEDRLMIRVHGCSVYIVEFYASRTDSAVRYTHEYVKY